ncbi:MAG: hypothetical protein GX621_18705 [Pirellulaceae bacterium]|nr:hypothetical protein [Pirellulaceae bacterium]
MTKVRCEYCHEYVDRAVYSAYCRQHLRLQPDGQLTDYMTLPEEEREHGVLDGVPRVYVHRRCGAATEMPDEIIRSYLKNPYLYYSDRTFCTGCGDHVPWSECEWTETGQNLQKYIDRLRAEKPEMRPGILKQILIVLSKLFG